MTVRIAICDRRAGSSPRRAAAAVAVALLSSSPLSRAAPPAPQAQTAPTATLTVTPARTSLELGIDKEVEVAVDLAGPDAERFTPARALATVGTLEPLRARAPGHFVARYVPPDTRFPQVALLVVELANGAERVHAGARIPLACATAFPFHTSGGASVTMRVGDRQFGPVVADKQGHVEIPIEVPPGVRHGQARATDRNGASRETEVDLQLPSFPRVALLAPDGMEAGSLADVTVLAVDETGAPAAADTLTLAASAGLAHPLGAAAPGEARFLYEAPVRLAETPSVKLTATAAGDHPGFAEANVALRPGAPRSLEITSSADRLVVGDPRPVQISMTARDRFGNATPAKDLHARVDGHAVPVAIDAAGVGTLRLSPPARYTGQDGISIEAGVADISAGRKLHVTGGAPARVTVQLGATWMVGDGHRGVELRARVVDHNGTPTAVPGLAWETPNGHIRDVRVPHDGEYLAEYVPDRTRDPHTELVTVTAAEALRASAHLVVTPPPVRLIVGARAGVYTNFGHAAGPVAFAEGLAPVRVPRGRLAVGLTAGYLRGDMSTPGVERTGTARLETNLLPLQAMARGGFSLPYGFNLDGEVAAGWSWAWLRVTASPSGSAAVIDSATANAPALAAGAEASYPLKPGRLTLGVRYLWIDLGRTSTGDQIEGNSAGLIADLGYKMTF
ncbi:MAG TPA: hypothetical protein VHG72_11985 [Polyangia bacterium]|nr:hypothetical protein [Polyangia bacterium]